MSRLSKESAFCSVASTSQEGLEEEAPASASNRTLKVTLLSSQWKSSNRGLSTINRELAIQLAKHPNVEASVYLPQFSEEDKKIAARHNVQLIKAEELPGYEAVDWLASVPENHAMDCIIGHGVPLGRQIPLIKRHNNHCKWIQIVHTAPEELGMYKTYADAISKGEKKHQAEVKLCELADQVVAVGPKLADAYSRSLRPCQKDQEVLTLTPGIFTEFSEVKQATEEGNNFVVLVFGCADSADFELKGYDIAAKAIAELKDMPCHLMFVGAPSGKEEEVRKKLLDYGISPAQLTVRCFDESREGLAKLLCEVDLAIMPSRTEGFGLTALEALSAGLPVLVSGNSGLGEAFKKVATGSHWILASEEPTDWAKAISAVRELDRDIRLQECEILREKYDAKYSWQKQCYSLVETMQKISFACLALSVECESVKLKGPSSQNGALDSANSARPKEGTKETVTTAVTNDVEETDKVVLNKEATAGSSDHGRPPLPVGYNQLSFTAVTQPSTQTHQTSHTQIAFNEGKPSDRELDELAGKIGAKWETLGIHLDIDQDVLEGIDANAKDKPYQMLLRWRNTTTSATPYGQLYHALCHDRVGLNNLAKEFCCSSGYGRPPSSVEYNQMPFTPVTQSSTQTYQTNHTQSFPGRLPSSVEYNQLPSAVASQNNEGYNNCRSHTQSFSGHVWQPSSVGYNQLPLVRGAQTYRGPSGYGWPPLTMEYNRTSYPATTQTFGEAAYQGMHTQIDVRVILSATMKFEAEHEECVRVLPYLNNGDVEIHLYVYRDRSGIPTKLENAAQAFFGPKDWKLIWADLYNDAFNLLQVTSIKYPSGEPKRLEASQVDEIEEIIDKHLHVFSNHRNVTAVQPSFKVTKSVQTEEACIVAYVLGKGQIPMGESAIPSAIGPYPVDIVNGFCVRTRDPYMPTEAHKQKEFLRLGASIGVNGKQSSGTLGAIVEDKNSGTLYALSCDHVMNNADKSEIIHPGLDVYLNCLRFNLNGYKNWIDRITGFALELPQISDDSLEETELQKMFVELKKVKEMRIDPKGCSNSVKEQITIFERNLEEAFGKPPRVIASYSAGVRCNVGSKMNNGREHFIDAAISELNEDEVNNVKTEKFLHIIDTTHYPSGECISATINATMDVEELFKSGSATGFTESSLILGISQRLPTFLTDFRPNGDSAWIDVDCINCKKRGTAQSPRQELSGLCEQCRPYRWLKRCLCIQQHGRKPFSDKGDSGAVIFEKLRKENGNEYQLPSPGFGIIFAELPSQHGNFAIASPLEIALEELSQKVSESRPDNEPCRLRLASSFR